ncbi:hypothetical protein MACK_002210 [Theileria orientalis]|uniref:GPI mannosyltransferase 2 n=1 Tax=Theileria orientalis TaxID=68886 RepID=A0A976MBA7_THEOR|nr:hypothetical protein MACK_002210 [Theileria orientalis]
MPKLRKSSGILRVVLTCVVLRVFLVTYTLYISNFPKLAVPKYQYNLNFINLNGLNGHEDSHDNDVHLVKSRSYLKGEYRFPVTTFFGFFKKSRKDLDGGYEFEKLNRNWLKLIPFTSWDAERPFSYVKNANGKLTKLKLSNSEIERIGYFSCFAYNISPGFIFTTSFYGYLIYCGKLNLKQFVDLSKFDKYLLSLFAWILNVINIKTNNGSSSGTDHVFSNFKSLFDKLDDDYERPWCNWRLPSVYKYVQKRYWGVKLFYSFSSVENAVHLLYTLPTIVVIVMYMYQAFIYYYSLCKEALSSTTGHTRRSGAGTFKKVMALYNALNTCEFWQSLCLIQYLLQFSIIINNIYSNNHRGVCTALFLYHMTLCFVGIILFSNFIGWT